jgi:DNA-binding transcriptional MerR regulator
VAIGEFSRLTHLTVKTLRYYHEQGLLLPDAVDETSRYRRYSVKQVPDALLIGRLRALEMPLADIRRVLLSGDTAERDRVIADHLLRMEAALDRTRTIVASLRGLLTATPGPAVRRIVLPELATLTLTARVDRSNIQGWCGQAFATLFSRLAGPPVGPPGALYGESFFTEAAGEVTAYVPVAQPATGTSTMPGGPCAVATHTGPYSDLDQTYAALGSWVAGHADGAPGPIREIYLTDPSAAADPAHFRTDVCWPLTR